MQVTIPEASRRLRQLIRSARAGEDVVISQDGKPVVRLIPMEPVPTAPAAVGRGSTICSWLARHRLPSEACRSVEDIDAAIAAERDAWD